MVEYRDGRDLSHAPFPLVMKTNETILGRCPTCGKVISTTFLLVEYQRSDGSTGIWAECPRCDVVVEPE